MDEKAKKILSKLETQCSKREFCTSDIFAKALKACEGDKEAAGEIIASLKADRYVDDFRYASAFAREKSSISGWGPVKIRFALNAKKVPAEAIEAAFEDIDCDKAQDKLEKVMITKWKTLEGDPQAKLKLLKFALGRGYEYDEVREMAERICRG